MPPRCIFATPFPLDFYCLFSVEAVKAGVCVLVCVCGMGKLQRSKLLLKLFKVIRMCKRWRKKNIYIIYRCIYKYIYMYITTRTTLACVWVCVYVCKFMAAAGKMSVYVTGEIYVLPINVSSCELQHTRNGIMWQGMEGEVGQRQTSRKLCRMPF